MEKKDELFVMHRKSTEAVPNEHAGDEADLLRLNQQIEVQNVELEQQNEELRLKQVELEASRSEFQNLYDSAPVGFVTVNPDGIVTRANRLAAEMLAGPNEILTGKYLSHRICPEDYYLYQSCLKKVAGISGRHTCEVRFSGKNGGFLYVRIEAGAVFDEAINLTEWRLAISDVTELKRAEEQILSLARFPEENPNPVLRVDAEGQMLYGNPASRLLLNPCGNKLGQALSADLVKTVQEVLNEGSPKTVEVPCGPRIFQFCFGPVAEGPYVNIYGGDITEIREAEYALRQLNDTLEQQVAERTQLAETRAEQLQTLVLELTLAEQRERRRMAEILHDNLQQLLVAAKMNCEIICGHIGREQKHTAENTLKLITQSIQTSRSLTAELSPPVLKQGRLSDAMKWLIHWMRENHGMKIKLKVEAGIDPDREDITVLLFQSIRELLFNVVKHAGVKSARVEMARDEKNRLRVAVIDKGSGFDPDTLWEKAKSGTGFGLFSIRERLMLLGGSLEVESSPENGASFSLVVPLEATSKKDEKRISKIITVPHVINPMGDKIRVLLADDRTVVRQGLFTMLNMHSGIEVIGEAPDGEAAVRMSQELKPDVILMDINMPNMDGLEATRIIHSELPHIRIIGLSMCGADALSSAEMIEAGASVYCTKNGETDVLLSAIRGEA